MCRFRTVFDCAVQRCRLTQTPARTYKHIHGMNTKLALHKSKQCIASNFHYIFCFDFDDSGALKHHPLDETHTHTHIRYCWTTARHFSTVRYFGETLSLLNMVRSGCIPLLFVFPIYPFLTLVLHKYHRLCAECSQFSKMNWNHVMVLK